MGKESELGHSLNEQNLKAIIIKTINSAEKDEELFKDESKASGMVVDVDDLDYLTDNVIAELKQ